MKYKHYYSFTIEGKHENFYNSFTSDDLVPKEKDLMTSLTNFAYQQYPTLKQVNFAYGIGSIATVQL